MPAFLDEVYDPFYVAASKKPSDELFSHGVIGSDIRRLDRTVERLGALRVVGRELRRC